MPASKIMKFHNGYEVEKSVEGISLVRQNLRDIDLTFLSGLCDVNPSGSELSREREDYIKKVLNPLFAEGKIDTGVRFDDRKLRFSGARIKDGTLEILTGITYYQRFKQDYQRDETESMALQELGKKNFGDKYAYFSRPLGVSAAFLTSDKSLFVGERNNDDDHGQIGLVSGYIDYRENLQEISVMENLSREANEELGMSSSTIDAAEMIGVFTHPFRGDVDITYLVTTSHSRDYFLSNMWRKNAKDREHKQLIEICSYKQIQKMLSIGNFQYPARGLLENLVPNDFD